MPSQPHLQVDDGDVNDLVLLPGDPGRVDRIAGRCTDAETVARNREYKVVNANYEGRELSICSTGIGCPSATIAIEELARAGVETAIRVGTTGALQEEVGIGDLVVATGAAKQEGTTRRYEPVEFPAVPDHGVLSALVSAAEGGDGPAHVGPIVSDDAFYFEREPGLDAWEEAGLLAVEMEAAALFTLARRRGLAAGAICAADGNLVAGTQKGTGDDEAELPEEASDGVGRAIGAALEAATKL
ncbi:nucleoside phosphorylase [Saliphagus infecundisoli]|uniref:Nucleoside phosphorylase n=1 Tax=Saliphagus infecundisoli TaxID=1849069 RepID=A0ABD5QG93_9EURY|nr:nucleoside phosphorylase [Saliphagus infecundisoli]